MKVSIEPADLGQDYCVSIDYRVPNLTDWLRDHGPSWLTRRIPWSKPQQVVSTPIAKEKIRTDDKLAGIQFGLRILMTLQEEVRAEALWNELKQAMDEHNAQTMRTWIELQTDLVVYGDSKLARLALQELIDHPSLALAHVELLRQKIDFKEISNPELLKQVRAIVAQANINQ